MIATNATHPADANVNMIATVKRELLAEEQTRHAAELDGIRAACDARVANVVKQTNEMAQKREDRSLAAADQRWQERLAKVEAEHKAYIA